MAYALQYDGVNDHVTATALAFSNPGGSNVRWDLEFEVKTGGATDFYVLGEATTSNYVTVRQSTGAIDLRLVSSNYTWTGVVADPENLHKYKLEARWTGGTRVVELFVDGVSQGTKTTTSIGMPPFVYFGGRVGTFYNAGFVSYIQYNDLNNSANDRLYDARSTSTGSTLPETINSVNGTLVNFPTDDSQWVNLGGGLTVTLTGITSTNTFGISSVIHPQFINLSTVDSSNTFDITEIVHPQVINAVPMESVEDVPSMSISLPQIVTLSGIDSSNLFGILRIDGGEVAVVLAGSINDRLSSTLANLGYTGALNDKCCSYLRGKGYTGAFNDMLFKDMKANDIKSLHSWIMAVIEGSI